MTSATHASTIDVAAVVRQAVQGARSAAQILAIAPTDQKDRALSAMGRQLRSQREAILRANAQDVAAAKANGLAPPLLDRLTLTEPRFAEMVSSVEAVTRLPDPVGQIIKAWCQPNGIEIRKVRVPLGVVGIIYESRPNVTSDCAALCLKSGNAVVLRGGREAFSSNWAIARLLQDAVARAGLPRAAISVIPTGGRGGGVFADRGVGAAAAGGGGARGPAARGDQRDPHGGADWCRRHVGDG